MAEIRAHLATFPPRLPLLQSVFDAVAPQVDRLFVTLNRYSEIPDVCASHRNIEPVIPDDDLEDTGKFLHRPAPDDIVFLIDDDIRYPQEYVQSTLQACAGLPLDTNVFGYQANLLCHDRRRNRTGLQTLNFAAGLDLVTGVDIVGTGTVCALGRNIAPFEVMRTARCFADLRYARWLYARGVKAWALPRPEGFLRNMLPRHLKASSIYETYTRHGPAESLRELPLFLGRADHVERVVW